MMSNTELTSIPITAELLLKNGFVKDGDYYVFHPDEEHEEIYLRYYNLPYDIYEKYRNHWVFQDFFVTDNLSDLKEAIRLSGMDNFRFKI